MIIYSIGCILGKAVMHRFLENKILTVWYYIASNDTGSVYIFFNLDIWQQPVKQLPKGFVFCESAHYKIGYLLCKHLVVQSVWIIFLC